MRGIGAFRFYEFFAGGGMARYGLGSDWCCLFANDIDEKKAACYRANFGAEDLLVADVASLKLSDLPGAADLVWASFPCQDLSLAGNGAGLNGDRSGTFWPFWRLICGLGKEGRRPHLVVLENVGGMLRSHSGKDFAAVSDALAAASYRFGALVIDAVELLPQSRPRLFIVGAADGTVIPDGCTASAPDLRWSTRALMEAFTKLSIKRRSARFGGPCRDHASQKPASQNLSKKLQSVLTGTHKKKRNTSLP